MVWSRLATQELLVIFDYFDSRNKSKRYSKKLKNLITQKLSSLNQSTFPNVSTTQSFLVENYRVYYSIIKMDLIILLVWDVRRNPNDLDEILSQFQK